MVIETKRCATCGEGRLSERVSPWLCPNPTCRESPVAPDPLVIHGRRWERVQESGFWWWAQAR